MSTDFTALKTVTTNVFERIELRATSVTPTAADICNDLNITDVERTHVALREGKNVLLPSIYS